jgi:hypothetical protein
MQRVQLKCSCQTTTGMIGTGTMKLSHRLLALPCYFTLFAGALPLAPLHAQEAKTVEKAKPEAPTTTDGPTAEEIILANIGVLENMDAAAGLLESVKDLKSAKIATAKLKKLSAELKQAFTELHQLGEPSEEERAKLEAETKLTARGQKVGDRFQTAAGALAKLDDKEAILQINPTLQEYGNIAKNAGQEPAAEDAEEAIPEAERTPASLADAEALSNDILSNMDAAAGILESFTDAASAADVSAKLDATTAKLAAIVKKMKRMKDLSAKDRDAMQKNEKLAARGEKVSARFQKAAGGLTTQEDKEAAALVGASLMKYGKAAQALQQK